MAKCTGRFISRGTYEKGLRERIMPNTLALGGFCAIRLSLHGDSNYDSLHPSAAEFPIKPIRLRAGKPGAYILTCCFVDPDFRDVFDAQATLDGGIVVPPMDIKVYATTGEERFNVDQGYFSNPDSGSSFDEMLKRVIDGVPTTPHVGELVNV